MDTQRAKSLAAGIFTGQEQLHAIGRNAENELVISWVQWSLTARLVSYHFALERIRLAAPMPAGGEIARSLAVLQELIGRDRVFPGPDVAPGPGVRMPPFEGPPLGPGGAISALGFAPEDTRGTRLKGLPLRLLSPSPR